MDPQSLLGWATIVGVLCFLAWRMRAQLEHLQYGKRKAALLLTIPFETRHVTFYGLSSLLYATLETATITAASCFMLLIGYTILMRHSLINLVYGVVGIVISAALLDATALLLRRLKIGHHGASRSAAVMWVSLMTALSALGAAVIVYGEGKLLSLRLPVRPLEVTAAIAILVGTFILSLFIAYLWSRPARLTWLRLPNPAPQNLTPEPPEAADAGGTS